MTRPKRFLALVPAALALAAVGAGCGGGVDVAAEDRPAAELFGDHCSGCHTLDIANSFGSKPEGELEGGERTNGPNFNTRQVTSDDVLFAIRNGGFSGAIMPANIVVGDDAEAVADFLAKYSGEK